MGPDMIPGPTKDYAKGRTFVIIKINRIKCALAAAPAASSHRRALWMYTTVYLNASGERSTIRESH
jgi:hypothetical protein